MTSLAFNGTQSGDQDFVVSGFYGPGGWAAWCISLAASWAPILLKDYTHNFHLIATALYMNWAAMDSFRFLSLRRKFDELAAKKEKLDRDRFFSIKNGTDTLIVQKHWTSNLDKTGLRSVFAIPRMQKVTRDIQGAELHSPNMTIPGLWDLYTVPITNDLTTQLQLVETQIDNMTENLQKEESLIWSQVHHLQATLAVLNLGMLHSWVQLLVCIWKTHKVTPTETAPSCRRRNLIALMGLVLPSIVQLTDLLFHNGDIINGWSAPIVWTMGIMITTTWCLQYTRILAPLLPGRGTILKRIFASIWALAVVGLYALFFCSLPCIWVKGPRCGLIPYTPSKITEMDQAFALFAALIYFVYDFRPLFVRFFKFLRLHFEKLLFGTQAHHNTWAGKPLGLPY